MRNGCSLLLLLLSQTLGLDAKTIWHDQSARHPLYGRDLRLLPSCGESSVESSRCLPLLKQARAYGLGSFWPRRIQSIWTTKVWPTPAPGLLDDSKRSGTRRGCSKDSKGQRRAPDKNSIKQKMEQILAGLGNRIFLMNNVHEDAAGSFRRGGPFIPAGAAYARRRSKF